MVAQDRAGNGDEQSGNVSRRELAAMRELLTSEIKGLGQQLTAYKELIASQQSGFESMISAFKEALNYRLVEMNNFRKAMEDQVGRSLTKDEYHGAHTALESAMSALAGRLDTKIDGTSKAVQELQTYRTAQLAADAAVATARAAAESQKASAATTRSWIITSAISLLAVIATIVIFYISRTTPVGVGLVPKP